MKSGTLGPGVLNIASLPRIMGVFTFDPGFMATAACESKITYIDGDEGVLLHRGIPIEQLAEKSTFLEVAYLLINGELPTNDQLDGFSHAIQYHTMINESLLRFFNGFQYNAHPMAMLSAVVASMAAFYHDSMDIHNPRHREIFAHRIIAKIPTIAAAAYKHSLGQPFIYPRNDLDYCGNLLHMFFACLRALQRRSGAVAGARPAVHPARRSRTERQHLDRAPGRQHRRQSVRRDLRRHLGAVGAGSWRRERSRARMLEQIGTVENVRSSSRRRRTRTTSSV